MASIELNLISSACAMNDPVLVARRFAGRQGICVPKPAGRSRFWDRGSGGCKRGVQTLKTGGSQRGMSALEKVVDAEIVDLTEAEAVSPVRGSILVVLGSGL